MMRVLLLWLVLLAAASGQAQDAASGAGRPDPAPSQTVALAFAGTAGSALLFTAASPLGAWPAGLAVMVVALPVGSAAGVALAGRAVGVDGTYVDALKGAALGTAIGLGASVAIVYGGDAVVDVLGLRPGSCEVLCAADAVLAGLVAGALVTLPTAFAVRHFPAEVAPAALVAPDGTAALGVGLRVPLP